MTNSKTCMLSIWFYLRNTRRRTAEWDSMVRASLLTTSSPWSTTTRLLHIKVDRLAILSFLRKCLSPYLIIGNAIHT